MRSLAIFVVSARRKGNTLEGGNVLWSCAFRKNDVDGFASQVIAETFTLGWRKARMTGSSFLFIVRDYGRSHLFIVGRNIAVKVFAQI